MKIRLQKGGIEAAERWQKGRSIRKVVVVEVARRWNWNWRFYKQELKFRVCGAFC